MDDWLSKQKNVLDLIRYMRKKSRNALERRYTDLRFLDQLCSGNASAMAEVGSNHSAETRPILRTLHAQYATGFL